MKEPTQRAIDAAGKVSDGAYTASQCKWYDYDYFESTFDVFQAATIIQAAIDEAVREALEKAADRAQHWLIQTNTNTWESLHAAILGEEQDGHS